MTVHKDFSNDDEEFFKRYVNRWRLECDGEPGADGSCDSIKPITYYIDHTVPVRYRKAMMEGVTEWSNAFEAAGFRNAVRAEMLPEDADACSVAGYQLNNLNERINRRLSPPYNFDAYTEAHLREVQARIEKALEAGLSLEN